jgi:hypothetical protein
MKDERSSVHLYSVRGQGENMARPGWTAGRTKEKPTAKGWGMCGRAEQIGAAVWRTFSHPDYDCRLWLCTRSTSIKTFTFLSRVAGLACAGLTAGRELHPAPKVDIQFVSIIPIGRLRARWGKPRRFSETCGVRPGGRICLAVAVLVVLYLLVLEAQVGTLLKF